MGRCPSGAAATKLRRNAADGLFTKSSSINRGDVVPRKGRIVLACLEYSGRLQQEFPRHPFSPRSVAEDKTALLEFHEGDVRRHPRLQAAPPSRFAYRLGRVGSRHFNDPVETDP